MFADTDLVGLATLLGVVFTGFIGIIGAVINAVVALRAAAKAEEVKTDLAHNTKASAEINAAHGEQLHEIKVLVNNQTSVIKKDLAGALERLAAKPDATDEDKVRAEVARQASDIHEAQQKKLDEGNR